MKDTEKTTKNKTTKSSNAANIRQLTMPYECWRFLYWLKNGTLTYPEIDRKVNLGELIPTDIIIA